MLYLTKFNGDIMDMRHKLKAGDVVMLWNENKILFGVIEDLMVWENTEIELKMPAYMIKLEDGSYVIRRESQLYSVEQISKKYVFEDGKYKKVL